MSASCLLFLFIVCKSKAFVTMNKTDINNNQQIDSVPLLEHVPVSEPLESKENSNKKVNETDFLVVETWPRTINAVVGGNVDLKIVVAVKSDKVLKHIVFKVQGKNSSTSDIFYNCFLSKDQAPACFRRNVAIRGWVVMKSYRYKVDGNHPIRYQFDLSFHSITAVINGLKLIVRMTDPKQVDIASSDWKVELECENPCNHSSAATKLSNKPCSRGCLATFHCDGVYIDYNHTSTCMSDGKWSNKCPPCDKLKQLSLRQLDQNEPGKENAQFYFVILTILAMLVFVVASLSKNASRRKKSKADLEVLSLKVQPDLVSEVDDDTTRT